MSRSPVVRVALILVIGLAVVEGLRRGLFDGTTSVGGGYTAAPACDIPITYHVAAVDERFHLDHHEVRRIAGDAVAIWESATGVELFDEQADTGMPIRLIYDERQADARSRARNREALNQAEADLRERQEALERERAALQADRDAYQQRREELQRKREAYEQAVAEWNAGQAPRTAANRDRLDARREALERLRQELAAERDELEQRRAQLSDAHRRLEREAATHNEQVAASNRDAAAAAGFEMGRYQQRDGRRAIEVYTATSEAELRTILAHELGHALGIGHVDDPAAVMHGELAEANFGRTELTAADRAALAESCSQVGGNGPY